MDRLILDTTVLISSERNATALDAVIGDADDVAIAAITVAELLVGVEFATGRRRTARAGFVDAVLDTVTVEDYTVPVAKAHAALLAAVRKQGTPRVAHDLIIAATALASGRALVTSDERGFRELPGVELRTLPV